LTHFALGTSASPVSGNDTILGNEVYRAVISSKNVVSNKHLSTVFLDYDTGNGNTYTEAGLFVGVADMTANSGTLFSRVALAPFEKTSSKTLTIEIIHTFNG
jgi:hypothetical protein